MPKVAAQNAGAAEWLTVRDAAQLVGLNVHTLYRSVRTGRLPPGVAVRLGRTVRFSRPRLLAWLDAGGTLAVHESP